MHLDFRYKTWNSDPRILRFNIYREPRGKCLSFDEMLELNHGIGDRSLSIKSYVQSLIGIKEVDKPLPPKLEEFKSHLSKCSNCDIMYANHFNDPWLC